MMHLRMSGGRGLKILFSIIFSVANKAACPYCHAFTTRVPLMEQKHWVEANDIRRMINHRSSYHSTVTKKSLRVSRSDINEESLTLRSEKSSKVLRLNSDDPSSSLSLQLKTLLRIGIPSALAGILATMLFPFMALTLASVMNDGGVFAVLSQDSSQFVQNFLTVAGLLFSILVGQTYYFMYQQQEAVYYSLFNEVTEAKSLLEQVALVCQGRSRLYRPILKFIHTYVSEDLKLLKADPAVLLSARPVDDPLESIMYMTSVGVPSMVYDTVKSLRQARAARLGSLQRKLPKVHMWLLWILAAIELCSFPLLGAGTQTIGGYKILTVEGCLFGIMTFGIVMTLRVSILTLILGLSFLVEFLYS